MATIKDGNGGTDQAGVTPIGKALKVTLVDINGNLNSVPLATSTTGALEAGGNLAELRKDKEQVQTELLRLLLIEMRITNELLMVGLNLHGEQYENWRRDPSFQQVDVPNA